jgi:uncharacterized protein YjiK
MENKKVLLKKELIPQKNGKFIERITKESIKDLETLKYTLENLDKIVNPNFSINEEAKNKQIIINEKEKEAIKRVLNGETVELIYDL